jgi:TRAP-type C4-dicarboxylate transport system permease small subunit
MMEFTIDRFFQMCCLVYFRLLFLFIAGIMGFTYQLRRGEPYTKIKRDYPYQVIPLIVKEDLARLP